MEGPPKAQWLHFDVSLAFKDKAIARGAVLTDKYGPLEHVAKLDIASGDPAGVKRGEARLAQIAKCRGLEDRP